MRIGLSLSYCIAEIIKDKVSIDDVAVIITNTRAVNREEFVKLCKQYKNTYWWHSPDLAENIALLLYNRGKIIQPRVDDPDYAHQADSIWIELTMISYGLSNPRISPDKDPS